MKKILQFLMMNICLIVLAIAPFSSVVNAAGQSNPRSDRPGEIIAVLEDNPSEQLRFADFYPDLAGLNFIDVTSNAFDLSLVTDNGDVWVYNDSQGTYVKKDGIGNVKAIAASNSAVFVLKSDGSVWSWGCDIFGQLGRNVSSPGDCNNTAPAPVANLTNISKIAAGNEHILALKSDGSVWSWGNNTYGGVGSDTAVSIGSPGTIVPYPVQLNIPGQVSSVAAGELYSMALLVNGQVYDWGILEVEGGPTPQQIWPLNPTPTLNPLLNNVQAVLADYRAAFVLKTDGSILGWGINYHNLLAVLDQSELPRNNDNVPYIQDPTLITGLPVMQEVRGDNRAGIIGRSQTDELWVWGSDISVPLEVPNSHSMGGFIHISDTAIVFIKPTGVILDSITSTPSPFSINRGSQQQLTVTANYSDSSTQNVTTLATYASDNPGVASVNVSGSVSGVAVGQATITISYNGKTTMVPVTVSPIPPQPPTNLSVVNGSGPGRLNLSWNTPSDNGGSVVTNYLIFRRTGTNPFTQVGTSSTTSFVNTGLNTGTTYQYYVKAVNSAGVSSPSSNVSKQAPGIFGNPICILGICI